MEFTSLSSGRDDGVKMGRLQHQDGEVAELRWEARIMEGMTKSRWGGVSIKRGRSESRWGRSETRGGGDV